MKVIKMNDFLLEKLEAETERAFEEWLEKPVYLERVAKVKIWQPLQDYKDVGSFMAYNKGQKKPKPNVFPTFANGFGGKDES